MIIDQQPQVSVSDPFVAFPDWAFAPPGSVGVGPGPILRESIIVRGTGVQTSSVAGNLDDQEGPIP